MPCYHSSGLCCSKASWPLLTYFCLLVTRKQLLVLAPNLYSGWPGSQGFRGYGLPTIFLRARQNKKKRKKKQTLNLVDSTCLSCVGLWLVHNCSYRGILCVVCILCCFLWACTCRGNDRIWSFFNKSWLFQISNNFHTYFTLISSHMDSNDILIQSASHHCNYQVIHTSLPHLSQCLSMLF